MWRRLASTCVYYRESHLIVKSLLTHFSDECAKCNAQQQLELNSNRTLTLLVTSAQAEARGHGLLTARLVCASDWVRIFCENTRKCTETSEYTQK